MADETGFLSRRSRRKAQAKDGGVLTEAVPAPVADPQAPQAPSAEMPPPAQTPTPALADARALTRDSDYAGFAAADVDATVKNAALKQLFGNPHFNVMDGLDT